MSLDGLVNVNGEPVPNLEGKVAGTMLLLENGVVNAEGSSTSVTPGEAPIFKRARQGNGG